MLVAYHSASIDLNTSTLPGILTEIFANFGQMVWSKDILTGKVHFLTDNFGSVFEMPMDLIRMEPAILKSCVHPEDAPLIDLYSKVLLTNNVEELEYRILTPAGNVKWIRERKQLVKNDLGEIIRLDTMLTETTDHKSEELKLIDSEATFKSLFYKNPNPMWVYDTESLYFLAVNDAAVKFYGYTHDEFFRMTVRQIRPQEDVDDLLQAIRNNNLESRSDKNWRHLRKDGSLIYVKLISNSIQFRGHKARLVLANDVTQQVSAESQMEKVYRYLERFQEAVSKNSFLALMDNSGTIVFVNDNLLQATGFKSEQLIGKPWSALQSSIYKEEQNEEINQFMSEQKSWRGERKFFRKQGSHFWVNCSIIPILDSEDNPAQYLLIADDISNLKEAEKRNKDYAMKLHNILEGVTDALFVLDKNWLLSNINLEAEKLFKKKRNSLIGKNIWEIFPADEGAKFYQFFRKAKKRRITVQFEEFYAPKDLWYDISLYPSKDGLAVCFRDVTERRKKESEHRELMEQLLAQNRDLEEFTFITSHSLRAQIANISMLCSAIDLSGLTPSNHEIFEKLFQCSGNLDSVIEDLNTILTVKDRHTLIFENVNIQSFVIDSISKVAFSFSRFKKFITTDIAPDVELFTVRHYFEAILIQIITNSLKFRAMDRDPEINIRGFKEEKHVVITFQDNGKGLDIALVKKQLFHLYKTFHPGVSGRGLGLYLCKILVDELKGIIDIESEENKGTLITVRFPGM